MSAKLRDDLLLARSEIAAQKMKIDKLNNLLELYTVKILELEDKYDRDTTKMHENFKDLAEMKLQQEKAFNKKYAKVVEYVRTFLGESDPMSGTREERLLNQVADAIYDEFGKS